MSIVRRLSAVFRFEWKRSLTVPRMAWWVVLAAFPPALFGFLRSMLGPVNPQQVEVLTAIAVFVLCPGVVSMMGVFLWATPAISSELEGQSWVYLAVRPYGAVSVLLGKYLVAVSWTLPAALLAALASVAILNPGDFLRLAGIEAALVTLSCLAYAAVFTLIGVIVLKRTMVVGVAYALFAEVILSMIPAFVNKLTIQYRLRCLLVRWMDWDVQMVARNDVFASYFEDQSAWWHAGALLLLIALMLGIAALILQRREFSSQADGTS